MAQTRQIVRVIGHRREPCSLHGAEALLRPLPYFRDLLACIASHPRHLVELIYLFVVVLAIMSPCPADPPPVWRVQPGIGIEHRLAAFHQIDVKTSVRTFFPNE